jgi:accessory gene regulator B
MIEGAASCIVDLLIRYQTIEHQQAPIYQYGFEILISSAVTCFIAVGLGIAFKCLFASLLYFGMFVVLRSICGGYHANTYWQCNIVFLFVTLLVLSLFKFLPVGTFSELHCCITVLSILVTAVYAPVENPNKPLDKKKKTIFHIISMGTTMLLALISCLLLIKFRSTYSILIDATLLVVAVSMFVTDPWKGGEV